MPIDVALTDRGPFRPGDRVRVTVAWSLPDAPQQIDVRLVWRTSGKGSTDVVVAVTEPRHSPPPDGRWETTLTIPPDAPPSYDGRLLSVAWSAEAAAGRVQSDEAAFVVSPTGRPVVPPNRAG